MITQNSGFPLVASEAEFYTFQLAVSLYQDQIEMQLNAFQ